MHRRVALVSLIVFAAFATLGAGQDIPPASSAELVDTGVPGQSVLLVRFVEQPRFQSVTIYPYDRAAVLRDDGRAPDTRAGDGLFAAAIPMSFATEAALFDRNREAMVRLGRIPIIVERELKGWIKGLSLPKRTQSRLPIFAMTRGVPIDPARSLMITGLSVVEDPTRTWNPCAMTGNANGIWTFKHLMTQMCNQALTSIDPADFVENWLNTWAVAQTINTFSVPARPTIDSAILASWPRDGNNKLILDAAPFRLLAIVNRVDLRVGGFYGGGTAGELRFVFSLVNCASSQAEPFLVILEYKVPIAGCANVKAWGQQWANLSTHTLGSTNYLNALQAITLQVTESNLAPTRPNGSALGQLRTNEFLASPWELREFKLPTGNGNLTPSTVAMTPDPSFENGAPQTALGAWLDTRPPGPVIPLTVSGIGPMLGGNATSPGPNWHWNPPTSTFERRFKFSLNTCNACHAGETQTWFGNPGFRHVVEEFFGTPAGLSAFLVGDPTNAADGFWHDVNDPVNGVEHLFFDLEVRRLHLDALIASSCLSGVVFQTLASPH